MSIRSSVVLGIAIVVGLVMGACAPRAKAVVDASVAPTAAAVPNAQTDTSRAGTAALVLTTPNAPFARSSASVVAGNITANLVVDLAQKLQPITGFGGAFNEKGWEALQALGAAERDVVLKSLFDPREGLRFNWGRVPVGASDYAIERYTLDETRDDFDMKGFSIERDKQRLIPYIQAAQKFRPDLRLWASAWTPPTWMKTNSDFDGGAMRDDPKVYAAYALYLAKFVKSYGAIGINIAMVVPQNEPAQLTHYPSCDWQPRQYVSFIADHLAPTFRSQGVTADIFVGTINRADWDVLSVLEQERLRSQIKGVALQWQALPHVSKIHSKFPSLEIMQSETECGNNHWEPGFNRDTPPNDFRYAAYTWRKFRDFIRAGSSSYMLWNMVLDEHGKSIDSQVPWPQNSAVVVNRTTKSVTYTPMFWVTKHFSGLVDTGAHLVQTSGNYLDGLAFVNPDGTAVVELLNSKDTAERVVVKVAEQTLAVDLPPISIATLLVPKSSG